MGCEVGGAYDRFRAVHDVLGHGLLQVGFDRDGEFAAWRFQERFHSELARRALATELHGEHSVRWTTGELPEHKAALLDERLILRSRAGLSDPRPVPPRDREQSNMSDQREPFDRYQPIVQELIDEHVRVSGDIISIDSSTWAIHGVHRG